VQDSYDIEQVVTFSCARGFVRNGAAQIVCLGSGDWSDLVPTCNGKKNKHSALVRETDV